MKTIKQITKNLLLITILLLSSTTSKAQNHTISANGTQIQVSSSLQTLLNQVEKVYMNPSELTIKTYYNAGPFMIPTYLGLIMHRQEIMMKEINDIEHLNNLSTIENEIMTFLEQLAQAHNNRNPYDNSDMDSSKLKVYYFGAVNGDQNDFFINEMNLNPTTVEIAYLFDHFPEDRAKVIVKDEEKTEINLFGEVSGYAMSGPEVKQWQDASGNTKVDGLVCPEKNKSTHTYFFDIDTNNIPNDGTDVRCVYFGKDGPLREQNPYVNNKKHGVFFLYLMDGDVRYLLDKITYANGKKHGVQERYTYSKGKHYLSLLITYANDKKEGVEKYWSDNSAKGPIYLARKTYYSNDKKNGTEKTYRISTIGQTYLSSQTSYANGEKNGEHIGYRETGEVVYKFSYKNDKKHGQCISYSIPRGGNQTQISHCITTYNNGVEISEKCWGPKGNIVRR